MSKHNGSSVDGSIAWIIGGVSLLAIVLIGFVAWGELKNSPATVAGYQSTDAERPIAGIISRSEDFGKMNVSEEKTATFTITNEGKKPLSLYGATTSCGCTFGRIAIGDLVSPEFSMHSKSTWTGVVEQGRSAVVTVTYKPSIMPVKGPVSRVAYVKTNDPDSPELTFTVSADVE